VQLRRVDRTDRVARCRRDQWMSERVFDGVEHPFITQLLLRSDGVAAVKVGERARSTCVSIASQHREAARQCTCATRESLEPISDEPHELRRRATVGEHVAQRIKATDARLL
jgi:hypothetical protein